MDNNFQPNNGMNGQPFQGQPMMGQPMDQQFTGQPMMGQPMMGQPMNQPMMSQPAAPQKAPKQPGGKSKTGFIVTLIVFIASIAGLATAFVLVMNSKNKKYDELEEKYAALQIESDEMLAMANAAQVEVDSLNAQVSALNAELEGWQQSYEELQAQYDGTITSTPSVSTNPTDDVDGTYYFSYATDGSMMATVDDFTAQGMDISGFGVMVYGNICYLIGGSEFGFDQSAPAVFTYDGTNVSIDDGTETIYGTLSGNTLTLTYEDLDMVFVK